MGAYEYGSFPLQITGFLKAPVGQVDLTWKSRRGDTYVVLSSASLDTTKPWTEEARVPSGGETTSWTDPSPDGSRRFYGVELE